VVVFLDRGDPVGLCPGIVGQLSALAAEVGDASAVGVGGGTQHVRGRADEHGAQG
jgi:hypothetical protein